MARAERGGFTVRIWPRRDVTDAQALQFLRNLEDYFEARSLQAQGTQLIWQVSSCARDLSETDAVNLLDWLAQDLLVSEAQLSLQGRTGAAVGPVLLRVHGPAISALSSLYRLRRLSASMYLQILRGAPDAGH